MPSLSKIRSSSVASAANCSGVSANEIIDVDAEDDYEDERGGVIPFLTVMPLPSLAVVDTIPPYAVKSDPSTGVGDGYKYNGVEEDDDQSHASNGTSGAVFSDLDRKQPSYASSSQSRQEEDVVVPHPSLSSGSSQRKQNDNNNKIKKVRNDIYLTLENEKYKKIITKCWALLWGERNTIQGECQTQTLNESPKGSSSSSSSHRRWQKTFTKMKEDNFGEDPSPKALAQVVYNAWKEKINATGGQFYRGSKGRNTFHKATAKEAVQKIWQDLQKGKFSYEGSRFRKNESLSGKKEPVASNYSMSLNWNEMSTSRNEEEDLTGITEPVVNSNNNMPSLLSKETGLSVKYYSGKKPVASNCGSAASLLSSYFSPKGPTHLPVISNPDRDLVISLRDSKYHRIITNHVEQLLNRCHDRSSTAATVALDQVKSVRNVGGKFFKIGSVEVDDEEALIKIKRDLQEKLADARKKDDGVVIANMKNEKYKHAVMEIIAKENNNGLSSIDSSWAEDIGVMLLEQFTSSGVEHFFKNASDDTEIECTQVVKKMVKDVRVQARYFGVPSARSPVVINDGIREESYISSTRKKRKSIGGKSNIQSSKRDYMTNFIVDILPKFGWTVKSRIMKNGLEDWVASRKTCGTTTECIGYNKILEEAYLSGFYEEHVVGTVEGKEFLENAGILDIPFSIFSEELKRRRKRRKIEEQTNDVLPIKSQSQEPKKRENADGPGDNSTSPTDKTLNADDTINGACGLSVESKTQSSDQNASVSEINFDAKEDIELTVTHSFPEVNAKHSNNIAMHALGGTPLVLTMNESKNGSSSPEMSLNEISTAKLLAEGVINENKDNKVTSESQKNKRAGSVEQAAKSMVTGNLTSHQSAVASPAINRKKLVRQLYRRMKTLISGRHRSAEKIETLRSEFYSHLKSWLAPRMKLAVESDLEKAGSLMNEFESDLEHLETAVNAEDEEDTIFYTDCCECTVEECKAKFPV